MCLFYNHHLSGSSGSDFGSENVEFCKSLLSNYDDGMDQWVKALILQLSSVLWKHVVEERPDSVSCPLTTSYTQINITSKGDTVMMIAMRVLK